MFHALMRSRRSIRNFSAGVVSDAVLGRLLASATAAPSAHNRQPWRFVIIEEPPVKAALARAMGARLAADRRRDGDAAATIEHDVARSYARLTGAPVLIMVNLTLEDADAYPDARRRDAEFLMAVQGTAMAAQNLLLGAHAEGLAACWMCAPLFCPDVVRECLGLPAQWQPQGLIALGVAADTGRERARRPSRDVAIRARDLAPSRPGGDASRT